MKVIKAAVTFDQTVFVDFSVIWARSLFSLIGQLGLILSAPIYKENIS